MSVFRFKQFSIRQEQSAFKVGTDSILLGAWANPALARQALDIGTGTGILALMLAQKTALNKTSITAIDRDEESALELFQRTCSYNTHWIKPSHRSGDNMHNVSATISVKEDEWDKLKEAMWEHRDKYTGISLLPFNDSNYKQMPFETCDKETYDNNNNKRRCN